VILAVVGLALLLAFAIVPSLRNPGLIAALSGMFTVVATVGLSRRESR
jgi:hypothetical protein